MSTKVSTKVSTRVSTRASTRTVPAPLEACLDSISVHYSAILLLITSLGAGSADEFCLKRIFTKEL